MNMVEGLIFDIKEFSVFDGPGSRITVFMKGCPLRCKWCHNPEGLSLKTQLMHKKAMCVGCGSCLKGCSHPECTEFDRCIHSCPNGCISVSGKRISSEDLAEKVIQYADLLSSLGGGVTVSGGEPMMQADFVCDFVDKLKNVHKALQTSGYADYEVYRKVIRKFDYVMQDIKLADPKMHIKYTGVDNSKILKNIDYLMKSGKKFVFRIPLIPDITDTEENLTKISEIVGNAPVELLRYNQLARAKYDMLGMNYTLSDEKNRDEDFTRFFENALIR